MHCFPKSSDTIHACLCLVGVTWWHTHACASPSFLSGGQHFTNVSCDLELSAQRPYIDATYSTAPCYMYVCMHAYTFVYGRVYVRLCVWVCMYVCMYGCVCTYGCVCAFVCMGVYVRMYGDKTFTFTYVWRKDMHVSGFQLEHRVNATGSCALCYVGGRSW